MNSLWPSEIIGGNMGKMCGKLPNGDISALLFVTRTKSPSKMFQSLRKAQLLLFKVAQRVPKCIEKHLADAQSISICDDRRI